MTAVYGVSHFVIDLACIATMLGAVSRALGIEGVEGVVAAIVACPYDVRFINHETKAAESCNFCLDTNLKDGRQPIRDGRAPPQ